MGYGLWVMGCGLWVVTMNVERLTINGLWVLGDGLWVFFLLPLLVKRGERLTFNEEGLTNPRLLSLIKPINRTLSGHNLKLCFRD